ncbi:MAG: hypothetical protein ACFFDT_24605 [Candidatus Hodarchaeota archaeon]
MIFTPTLSISILGESGCGKTSLITSASAGKPILVTRTTTGSEHATIFIRLEPKDPDYIVAVQGFGGQRQYLDVIRSSEGLSKTDIILLCFDLGNETSFNNLPKYLAILNEKLTDGDTPIILVGLKNDLEWRIPRSQIEAKMHEVGIQHFVWCSSKTFENVYEPFRLALALYLGKEYSILEIPYHETQTKALITDFQVRTELCECTAEDCSEMVIVQITQADIERAAHEMSGITQILANCTGNSAIYGYHLARFFVDANGDIRVDKGAVPKPEVLSPRKKSAIILRKMVFKEGRGDEITSKSEQKIYWQSMMDTFNDIVQNELTSKIKYGEETEKDVENVYSLLIKHRLWKKLSLAELDDARITERDITDFFFWYWLVSRGLSKKKQFFKQFHRLTLLPSPKEF